MSSKIAFATVPLPYITRHVRILYLTVLHQGGRLHKLITCRKGSAGVVRPPHINTHPPK
jgi:hypothetical protein